MFWHALHCGLAEFGGYEDSRGEIYPYFVPRDALPPDARPVDCWSDQREVRFVQSVDPAIREWTPEYERVMRDDFFRIVRQNPAGTAGLIGRRLWRLMALNPWARHTADSELLPCWTDDLARAIWGVLCVGGLICGLPRRTLLVACGLLPLALPPLLVHSGYIMYNLAGQFPLYLLGIAGARAIQLRFSGRRQTRLAENDPR